MTIASSVLLSSILALSTFDHSTFDKLLKKHVKNDRVDYAALKADRASLDEYVDRLAKLPQADLEKMSQTEQEAFWINAYNALTLRSIVDAYPIKAGFNLNVYPNNSIRQIKDVWDKKLAVASQQLSLNDVENEILRKRFKDPRVHAAINCASRSCPPLRSEAFTGGNLDEQLDDNVRRFLADGERNRIDPEKKKIELSKVFDWFADDFGGKKGVLAFVAKYAPADKKKFVEGFDGSVGHLDYDWTLNDV